MKIAITGGAGFVGSHLTKAYLDAGHDVIVIDNLATGSRAAVDPRARFYHVDIRDGKLQGILQHEHPDVLSHHATQQHETGTGAHTLTDADVHVRGLINVLDSCVSASVTRFIFASGGNSMYRHIAHEDLPVREETPLQPGSAQDISKVAGEWYVRYYTQQYGLTHTIVRYADIYGETEQTHLHHPLSYFIQMLMKRQPPIIRGAGNEIRDHIFIDDVIQANLQFVTKRARGENRTFHISSGQGYSLKQLYWLAAQAQNSTLEPIHIAGPHLDNPNIILDNTLAYHLLDWQPAVPISEGIHEATLRLTHTHVPNTPATTRIAMTAEATLTRA